MKKTNINYEDVVIVAHSSIEDVNCCGCLVGDLSSPKCNECGKKFKLDEDND